MHANVIWSGVCFYVRSLWIAQSRYVLMTRDKEAASSAQVIAQPIDNDKMNLPLEKH